VQSRAGPAVDAAPDDVEAKPIRLPFFVLHYFVIAGVFLQQAALSRLERPEKTRFSVCRVNKPEREALPGTARGDSSRPCHFVRRASLSEL
jgi:hypothetical protein